MDSRFWMRICAFRTGYFSITMFSSVIEHLAFETTQWCWYVRPGFVLAVRKVGSSSYFISVEMQDDRVCY